MRIFYSWFVLAVGFLMSVESSEQKVAVFIVGDSTSRILAQSIYSMSKCHSKNETHFYLYDSYCEDDVFAKVDLVHAFGVSPVTGDLARVPSHITRTPGYSFSNSWAVSLHRLDDFLDHSINETLRVVLFTSNFWDAGRRHQQLERNISLIPLKDWLDEFNRNYTRFTAAIRKKLAPNDIIVYQTSHEISHSRYYFNLVGCLNMEILAMAIRDNVPLFRTDLLARDFGDPIKYLSGDGYHQTERCSEHFATHFKKMCRDFLHQSLNQNIASQTIANYRGKPGRNISAGVKIIETGMMSEFNGFGDLDIRKGPDGRAVIFNFTDLSSATSNPRRMYVKPRVEVGDIIIEVNDVPCSSYQDVMRELITRGKNQWVTLSLERKMS